MRGFASPIRWTPTSQGPTEAGGGLQEGSAQVGGLVSSGVDGGPGNSLHQQLQSEEKRESQTCEMLQHRDSSKRGNDVEQGGSPQGKEHCGRSGDLRDENDTSQILQTESFTFRLAACRHTGPVLWRALRLVSGSTVAVLKFLISF